MAQAAGRDFAVKKNSTVIASVRSKSITWNGTLIDTTNDDDEGKTTYLSDKFATTTLEISVEGMTDDDVLSDLAFSGDDTDKFLSDLTLERPNGDVISGTFILTNYVETGQYQEAVTFTATIVRSGAHTWTPAT
jgi:predicted secreted protein